MLPASRGETIALLYLLGEEANHFGFRHVQCLASSKAADSFQQRQLNPRTCRMWMHVAAMAAEAVVASLDGASAMLAAPAFSHHSTAARQRVSPNVVCAQDSCSAPSQATMMFERLDSSDAMGSCTVGRPW